MAYDVDYGNTKLHYIKGSRTACGCKVPGAVQRGWHVAEFGSRNPTTGDINCKRCLATLEKEIAASVAK